MQFTGFAVMVIFILGQPLAIMSESYQIETLRQDTGDILRVTNDLGDYVTTIGAFPEDKYQVVKPGTDDGCFVTHLPVKEGEGDSQSLFECYKSEPFPTDAIDRSRLADCDDRDIFQLKPKNCFSYSRRDDGVTIKQIDELPPGCRYEEKLVSTCVETERYCSRWGWWWNSHNCNEWRIRCTKYHVAIVKIIVCV